MNRREFFKLIPSFGAMAMGLCLGKSLLTSPQADLGKPAAAQRTQLSLDKLAQYHEYCVREMQRSVGTFDSSLSTNKLLKMAL